MRSSVLFWVLWGIDAVVAAIFVYFFLVGVGDHTVTMFNFQLWLGLLTGLALVLIFGWYLRFRGYRGWAVALVSLLAVPAIGALLMLLIILISNPRWN